MRPIFMWSSRVAAIVTLATALMAQAATPASGTLTDTSGKKTFTSSFQSSNPSGNASLMCSSPAFPCDTYALTVTLPAGYAAAHPGAKVKIATAWGTPGEDYDIYLETSTGSSVASSAGSSNPEVMSVPAQDGSVTYTVRIVPYTIVSGAGGTATTDITLDVPPPVPPQLQPSGLAPRYYSYYSPAALANSAGEPSIGHNWKSGYGMFIAGLETLRIGYPGLLKDTNDPLNGALPAICDAEWTDVSYPSTSTESLDPILWTNSKTGRTFVSQLIGANSLFAYTDDDGTTWTQGQIGPPNGGADHQTIATGPYTAASVNAPVATAAGYDYAVYYCSQSVTASFCARSETGGLTFGPGNNLENSPVSCGGVGALHGHAKVGPNGYVYVAPKDCGGLQAVMVSTNDGMTFAMKTIPGTDADTEVDPSVSIDAANRLYHCHVRNDHHVHVMVSDDFGNTWKNDYDIGAADGIQTTTFPEMVAGDKDRAACAFIGTKTAGNHDAADFTGIYFGYVATTYDGGKSWHLVNVTPNDPVQGAGGVCNGGTLCGNNRNLLDFNEMTMDKDGYAIFGFADGCIGACVADPIGANGFASKGTIVRQVGGKPLLTGHDPSEPAKPLAACLFGARNHVRSALTWRKPDNGGASSDISSYTISRATSAAGPYTQVGMSSTEKFDDVYPNQTVSDAIANYFYKIVATNSVGDSVFSNIVKLPIAPDPVPENSCVLPGIRVFTDPTGDSTAGGGDDVTGLTIAERPGTPNIVNMEMTIASLNPITPGAYYIVLTKDAAGNDIYLQADTSTGSYAYTYGTYVAGTAGVLTFTQVGTLDPSSSVDTTTGTINLAVPRSVLGNPSIGKALPIDVRVRVGAQSATSRDTGGPGDYTIRGTGICTPNVAPVAQLTADKTTGLAPLAVMFGVFGTDGDAGDTLSSYTLDFGDGSMILTDQPFTSQSVQMISHTYSAAGSYKVKLTVKDSRGVISSNVASTTIEPSAAAKSNPPNLDPVPQQTTVSHSSGRREGRFGGGSTGLASLLVLGAAALRRRRKP